MIDEKVVNDGNYEGDLNEENDACGWGICTTVFGHTYQGTMMNDKYHGYGKTAQTSSNKSPIG